MDLEDETATFGLRTLQDLGWKDLLDGFTCTECGRCQAACPANATGKPLNPKAFIMGIREMAVEAEHGIDLIPNSPLVRDAVRPRRHVARRDAPCGADRRRGDPVRRGLGLRHLRSLRRGLPGPHRARRQDRRAPPEPRPRGLALPDRDHGGVHEHGAGGQPVGPAGRDPDRLDEGPPVRGPDGGRAGRGRPARRDRRPLLGRLCGRVRRAQPESGASVRHLPRRGRRPVRDPRPGGVVHRRPGPPDGQRLRLADPRLRERDHARPVRPAEHRDRLPALLQYARQRVRPARRSVRGDPPLGLPAPAARRGPAPDDRSGRARRDRRRCSGGRGP